MTGVGRQATHQERTLRRRSRTNYHGVITAKRCRCGSSGGTLTLAGNTEPREVIMTAADDVSTGTYPVPTPEEFRSWTPWKRQACVLRLVTSNPDSWDQAAYWYAGDEPDTMPTPRPGCGTSACIAGWTVLLAGAVPVSGDPLVTDRVVTHDGREFTTPHLARRLLDLDLDTAEALFYKTTTGTALSELAAIVALSHGYGS